MCHPYLEKIWHMDCEIVEMIYWVQQGNLLTMLKCLLFVSILFSQYFAIVNIKCCEYLFYMHFTHKIR